MFPWYLCVLASFDKNINCKKMSKIIENKSSRKLFLQMGDFQKSNNY